MNSKEENECRYSKEPLGCKHKRKLDLIEKHIIVDLDKGLSHEEVLNNIVVNSRLMKRHSTPPPTGSLTGGTGPCDPTRSSRP